MSLGKRLMIGLPLAALLGWMALRLQASIWVEQIADGLSEDNDFEYSSTFFDLHGRFGANDVTATHYFPDGRVAGVYKVDRVLFTTPGLFWLFRNSFFRASSELPDRAGLVLENPRNSADDDNTSGNYTNLPYDAMGCSRQLLTPAEIKAMGIADVKRNVSIELERGDDRTSLVRYRMRTENAGQLEMLLKIGLERPAKLWTALQAATEAPLQSVDLSFTDLGFIAARRSYCPGKNGIADSDFNDYHMREVARRFGEEGLSLNPGALAQYRDFAEHGGTLRIKTMDSRKLTLGQFIAMNRLKEMQAFPSQIAANDNPPATFSIEWNGVLNDNDAAPDAAGPVAANVPAAPGEPATAPVSAPLPAGSATDAVIDYKQLADNIGSHIEITTTNGTVRRGTLLSYSPFMASVKLDPEDGGFNLTVPSDSVAEVRTLPMTTAGNGAQTTTPDAKTN